MAKLKAFYATAEEVPEALKEFYAEVEGKFKLDAEGVEDVTGLKSALAKEREGRRIAEATIKAFKDMGVEDPAKIKETLDKLEELQAFDPNKEADKIASEKMKAREAQLISTHQKELEKARGEGKAVSAQLQKVLIDNAAIAAISEAKGSTKLLLPIVHSRTRMRQNESGQFIAEVLDESGNPRIADGHGTPMTIKQLVEEFRSSEEFGRAFDSEGKTGSGGPTTGSAPVTSAVGGKKISIRDQGGLNANLEAIASGKVQVVD